MIILYNFSINVTQAEALLSHSEASEIGELSSWTQFTVPAVILHDSYARNW